MTLRVYNIGRCERGTPQHALIGFTPTPNHPSTLHTRARPYLLSRQRVVTLDHASRSESNLAHPKAEEQAKRLVELFFFLLVKLITDSGRRHCFLKVRNFGPREPIIVKLGASESQGAGQEVGRALIFLEEHQFLVFFFYNLKVRIIEATFLKIRK